MPTLRIVVDIAESRGGLAALLRDRWSHVVVRRLPIGDVAIGMEVLVERKTTEDFVASLRDGRLFGQARRLATTVARPVFVLEGDGHVLTERIESGPLRGAFLALMVGLRLPVLRTRDVHDTADTLRHLAAQQARRARAAPRAATPVARPPLDADAIDLLLALPGVGQARASTLAAHVGGVGDVARAGLTRLLSVPGIGPTTAARIADALATRPATGSSPSQAVTPTTHQRGDAPPSSW